MHTDAHVFSCNCISICVCMCVCVCVFLRVCGWFICIHKRPHERRMRMSACAIRFYSQCLWLRRRLDSHQRLKGRNRCSIRFALRPSSAVPPMRRLFRACARATLCAAMEGVCACVHACVVLAWMHVCVCVCGRAGVSGCVYVRALGVTAGTCGLEMARPATCAPRVRLSVRARRPQVPCG